jgi:hypothetical protein
MVMIVFLRKNATIPYFEIMTILSNSYCHISEHCWSTHMYIACACRERARESEREREAQRKVTCLNHEIMKGRVEVQS